MCGGGVGARNALCDSGWLRQVLLQGAVVSVGNLSTGGSGKTPFVMLLGELLKARGIKFDVLSRGYGRKSSGVRLVDPAGLPREFGDEPLLIARKLQVRSWSARIATKQAASPSPSSDRSSIYSTTAFSTVPWRATSTSFSSRRRTQAINCFLSEDCESRCVHCDAPMLSSSPVALRGRHFR